MKFVALYLGREENFKIFDVENQQEIIEQKGQTNSQAQKQEDLDAKLFIVKETTKVELQFKSKESESSLEDEKKGEKGILKSQFLSA